MVSGPLEVERRVDLTPSADKFYDTTCGVEQCLTVYSPVGEPVGLRSDRAGNWLDTKPILFPTVNLPPLVLNPEWVVAQGLDFIVGFAVPGEPDDFLVYRLKPNGDILPMGGDSRFRVQPLCVTDDRFVFRDLDGYVQVFTAELVPLATPIHRLPLYGIVGSTTCLVYGAGTADRLRLSDGVALDSPPPPFLPEWRMSGAYKAGNFVIVSLDGGNLVTYRIRESDGQVLDREDPLVKGSGTRLIFADDASRTSMSKTFDWGDDLFVTWTLADGSNTIVGARVDPVTGQRVDGSTTTYETVVSSESLGIPIYLNPSGGLVQANAVATPLHVEPGPPPVISTVPSAAKPLTYVLPSRGTPAAAATPTRYLVGWERDRSAASRAGTEIEATRVDPKTGAYLDDPALAIGSGTGVAIAGNGTDFLTAWFDGTNLQRRWVRADGSLEAPLTPIAAGTGEVTQTNLVFNGSRFALAWRTQNGTINVVRLDSAGTALDTAPLVVAQSTDSYAVTTDTAPGADRRSFAFVYSTFVQTDVNHAFHSAQLVRAEAGSIVDPPLSLGEPNMTTMAVSDGSKIVVNDASVGMAYLDTAPIGGSIVATPHASRGSPNWRKLWYDGRNYLVVEPIGTVLSMWRFEPSLEPLDSAERGSAVKLLNDPWGTSFVESQIATASATPGQTLMVYQQLESVRLGRVLKMRLIENDGLSAGGAGGAGGADGGGSSPPGGSDGSAGANAGGDDGSAGAAGQAHGGSTNGGNGNGGTVSNGGSVTNGGSLPSGGGTIGAGGASSAGSGPGGSAGETGGNTGGDPGERGGTGNVAGAGGAEGGASAGSVAGGTAGDASSGAAGASGSPSSSGDDGCSCRAGARSQRTPTASFALFGLALLGLRRRSARAGVATKSRNQPFPPAD